MSLKAFANFLWFGLEIILNLLPHFSYTLTVLFMKNTCTSFMTLVHQLIMWQQHNEHNHADTGQELQVMLTSNIRKTLISVTLTVA